MKYMGHKGRILDEIRSQIRRFSKDATTLCDPFCGSAVVAWDLAESFDKPVIAGDLQSFAAARAAAILTRTSAVTDFQFVESWTHRAALRVMDATSGMRIPACPSMEGKDDHEDVKKRILQIRRYVDRTLIPRLRHSKFYWPITAAYAGYFFSPQQALALDALRGTLPKEAGQRALALSALISAASRCSASPGHTAQPLGLADTATPCIVKAWNRPVEALVAAEIRDTGSRHAKQLGKTVVGSWEMAIGQLKPGDIAFCDPPYSGVHYSRFYHVLETLARGKPISVTGTGRNPPFSERPGSDFSRKTKSRVAAETLIKFAAHRDIRLVLTFPVSKQSNGLASSHFVREAKKRFSKVDCIEVKSVFSSLGGGGNGTRIARKTRVERIICCY